MTSTSQPITIESIQSVNNHRWRGYTIVMSEPSKNITLKLSRHDENNDCLCLADATIDKDDDEEITVEAMKQLQEKYVGSVYQTATVTMLTDGRCCHSCVDIATNVGTIQCIFYKFYTTQDAYIFTENFTQLFEIESM
jgi:hypothetical protein